MAQISTQKEKKNLSLILYVNNNQDSPFCWNRHDDGQDWQQPHVSLNSAPESPTTQHCNEILMLFVKNTHNLRVKPKSQHSTQQRAASFAAVLAYDGKDSCVDAVHNLKNVLGVWGCFCFVCFLMIHICWGREKSRRITAAVQHRLMAAESKHRDVNSEQVVICLACRKANADLTWHLRFAWNCRRFAFNIHTNLTLFLRERKTRLLRSFLSG